MIFQSCLDKQQRLKAIFSACSSAEMRYEKLIELGRSLPSYPKEYATADHLVKGCQSRLYLHTSLNENGQMQFLAFSDSMISAGLASLLLFIYQDEPPVALLKCAPTVLSELNIMSSLSPNRANGLRSLFLSMQQAAVKFLGKE